MILTTKQKVLWTLAFIAVVLAAFISLLPEPIDIDLTNIGNGKKSVVFVYDPNLVVSNQQSIQLNDAKQVIGDNANFLIARIGYPATEEFMQRYNAERAEVLFFDASGELAERRFAPVNANALVEALENK